MEIRVQEERGVVFIVPSGEMVAGSGDLQLKRTIDQAVQAKKFRVVVDLTSVPYIDSSVLGLLVQAFSVMKKSGGALRLLNPSKRIVDVLTLTRLITIFQIISSREQAFDGWP